MKVEIVTVQEFKPVTVKVTFESKCELTKFKERFDWCKQNDGRNYMSYDDVNKELRNVLSQAGY